MQKLTENLLIFCDERQNRIFRDAAEAVRCAETASAEATTLAVQRMMRNLLALTHTFGFSGDLWKSAVAHCIAYNENAFSKTAERKQTEADIFVRRDCATLRKIFHYDFSDVQKICGRDDFSLIRNYQNTAEASEAGKKIEELKQALDAAADDEAFYRVIAGFYTKYGTGLLGLHKAFVVGEQAGNPVLEPVKGLEVITLDDLIGYEVQKKMLTDNTEAFLHGKPANNVLLYGDGGTGKSTSVRAILNQYYKDGLRMIQIYRHQMQYLDKIIEQIEDRNYRFIIYMDDLSFEDFETEYKYLKAVIEGGLAPRPANVLIYATSNRRHLIKETWNDRGDVEHTGEIFRSDSIEEKRSLADRFGVQIYYGKPSKDEFHHMVELLAQKEGVQISMEKLHAEATKWEIRHSGVSGRGARQFIDYIKGTEEHTK